MMAVLATETRTPAGRRLAAAQEPTPQRPIVTRAEAGTLSALPVARYPAQPPEAGGDRLLSPHEIAILMVLASEPRRQQGDPADLRCLADRGLVRLDAAPLAEAPVRLSDDGCQIVSRLAECDRFDRDDDTGFASARRTASAPVSRGVPSGALR